jgi:large subunit ribosomal protein L16
LYEISGVSEDIALKALELAGNKLPFSTKIVTKENTL